MKLTKPKSIFDLKKGDLVTFMSTDSNAFESYQNKLAIFLNISEAPKYSSNKRECATLYWIKYGTVDSYAYADELLLVEK